VSKSNLNKKGVILFMILAILLIVAIVVHGILNFVLSHYQQTLHRARRIKAYYAAMAGINLAMDKLRRGDWTAETTGKNYKICHSCPDSDCNTTTSGDCDVTNLSIINNANAAYNLTELELPYNVAITLTGTSSNCNISAAVNYTSF
jgi:Tfp pilus assembly protein PilX